MSRLHDHLTGKVKEEKLEKQRKKEKEKENNLKKAMGL